MIETAISTSYRVVIESIGNASPAASKILAEALELPSELMFQALYNTPSVMVSDIDAETAEKTAALLRQLGLEASLQTTDEPAPETPEKIDVAVYLPEACLLPHVCLALSQFVGCSQQEALTLLLEEPAVVLGGVSHNTARALSERIEAEVMISDPKTATYTLMVQEADQLLLNQLQKYLDQLGVKADLKKDQLVTNLDFEASQTIWRRFQSTGIVKIINESFERYELMLTVVDEEHPEMRQKLIEYTGMPEDIVDEVLSALPVQLEASLNTADLQDYLRKYSEAGMSCEVQRISHKPYRLVIEQMTDLAKVKEVLQTMIPAESLPTSRACPWVAPVPLNDIMVRYAVAQLEQAGAQAEYEDYH